MKRIIAAGGAAAGLLAAAIVTTPAHAADKIATDVLAGTPFAANQIAQFWLGEKAANLIGASPYGVETKPVSAKLVSKGGPAPDSKPGIVPAIGDEKKSTARSKNVNLPKTTGKVFFLGADGNPHWCSATSVQAGYRNLVATAGHCVYDTGKNAHVLDKWVFIPGYYKAKAPWGIYVGKQAFTHYDFDVYEDADRDYAFVTVYNGVTLDGASEVKEAEAAKYAENVRKVVTSTFKTKEELDAFLKANPKASDKSTKETKTTYEVDKTKVVPKGTEHSTLNESATADEFLSFNPGKSDSDDGGWAAGTGVTTVEMDPKDYEGDPSYHSEDRKTLYFYKKVNGETRYYKRTFWVNYGFKATTKEVWTHKAERYFVVALRDIGRLGDNVGGQGLAYNQKVGKPVYVFGYPSGSHPDGNYAFTGHTLKWTYGKTFAVQAPAIKGEELVGTKSSFTGEGALGSSWLVNYSSGRRLGYLNGVTIGVSDTDNNNRYDTSYSPYFDGELYGVYKSAANLWSGKIV
ncbi:hypothetical protein [Microtetraspora sp. NBRC 16547]|uniref:trypsin-like serine peptidase n=1 Tax=Microtetraspora sp. NBRC 16547 TaxID=3030993 RepID=UPI0024A20115|nr:hypothetical protein [Microtetraspora sp. NBRC 16547]GLX00564.1 hypothetical protein Misp02_46500 [Microtetraspora sp. NBRC 16547]